MSKFAKTARPGGHEIGQGPLKSTDRYVAYYRRFATAEAAVKAQRAAVRSFIKEDQILAAFVEDIVGSRRERPALDCAFTFCREHNATLIIAKLGRLERSAIFTRLLRDAGVDFIALDATHVHPGNIGALAEAATRKQAQTADRISIALASASAEGRMLGNPEGTRNLRRYAVQAREKAVAARRTRAASRARGLAGVIEEIRANGASSLSQVAIELNRRGVPAPRGGKWRSIQVQRTIAQLNW